MTAIAKTDVTTVASPDAASKKKPGRPANSHDNRFVKAWMWRYAGIVSHDFIQPTFYTLPRFVDDVITGNARLATSNFTGLPANRGTILKALLTLTEITTKDVAAFLNRGRAKPYSASHVKRHTLKIIEASKAIDYHLERLEAVD